MNILINRGEYHIRGIIVAGEVVAGAKRVLAFPGVFENCEKVRVPIPGSTQHKELIVVTVVGDSLRSDDPHYDIVPGTQLLVNTRVNILDACDSLCVVRIYGCEDAAKYVHCNNNGSVTLLSTNPKYPPETFDVADIEIIGVVIGRHLPGRLKNPFA